MLNRFEVVPNMLQTRVDLAAVLEIYNEAIPHLATKPLAPQTPEEQLAWWEGLDHEKTKLYVYDEPGKPYDVVAFLLLTDRGDHFTPMFALHKDTRGKGYGPWLVQDYLNLAKPKPLRGSALISNPTINKINAALGWQVVGSHDGVLELFHPNGSGKENHELQP